MDAISINGLCKSYDGKKNAVADLNLNVSEGGIFGFLGPNGAGKTTTVKLLSGLLAPTGGNMSVLGFDPSKQPEKVHKESALLTETTMMYDHLTSRENLLFFGKLYGMEPSDAEARAEEALKLVDLTEAKGKLKTFSTGMRQRLGLARALMHRPRLLFLDEPTSGLDPESVQSVNEIISEQGKQGRTVFLCTHQLRYAEEICTSYGLMDNGRLLASGTMEELERILGSVPRIAVRASGMPDGLMTQAEPGLYRANAGSDAEIARLVRKAVEGGAEVYEVRRERDTLEDIYFGLLAREGGASK